MPGVGLTAAPRRQRRGGCCREGSAPRITRGVYDGGSVGRALSGCVFFFVNLRIRAAHFLAQLADPSAAMSAPPAAPPPTAHGTEICSNFDACGSTVAGGPGSGLCVACRSVVYCSRACQAAHWASHKVACKEMRKARKALAAAPASFIGALSPFVPTLAAAEAGDAGAQFYVAVAYASGTGVAQSWPSAFAWYKRCAAQRSPPVLVWLTLGDCYELGHGVAVDEVEAVRLYRVGAALGDAGAQCSLAQCLQRGFGVPTPDRDGAFALFTAAAAQGHPEAMYFLGNCYSTGIGVARDVPRAVSLWKRALALPDCSPMAAGFAAYNLGAAYWNGVDGVARDRELAARYWRQAADLGNEIAARTRREEGLA